MTATITAPRHPQYGTARKIKARPKTSDKPVTDRRCALRVKIKSLAAEAAIIRREEQRTVSYGQFLFLHNHRVKETSLWGK